MLHLKGALRCAIAQTDRLVIHPHPTTGTNNRDLPLELLPEAKFGSMSMQQCLSNACREAEGQTVTLHLLPHRFLNQLHLDSI